MSKDPAVSWYWNDWAGGTQGMTREEKGAYMELLQAQHSRGSVPLAWIRRLFGDDFDRLWEILKEKFQRDDDGFFNPRLREEIGKRRAYSESRKNNRTKVKKDEEIVTASESPEVQKTYDNHMSNISKSYDEHMGIGIGNNSSIVEHPYNGGASVTISQGGAGGNGIAMIPLDHLTVTGATMRMITQYGATGRQPNKTSIGTAIREAVTFCMNERPDKFPTARDAIEFMEVQAGKARDFDIRAGNDKRKGLERWLNERCFSDDIDLAEIATSGKKQSWKDTIEKF